MIGGWKIGIGRTARMEMARVLAMAVMAMMLNPIRGMILIAITIMNSENKHNQQLTPMRCVTNRKMKHVEMGFITAQSLAGI